jgi:hypothetical protein
MLLGCLSVLSAAFAVARSQARTGDDFICTSPTERREIRVVPGCHVEYTKDRGTSTLWSSHDPAYCAAKAAGLVATLVKANFSCKTETTAGTDPAAEPATDND